MIIMVFLKSIKASDEDAQGYSWVNISDNSKNMKYIKNSTDFIINYIRDKKLTTI